MERKKMVERDELLVSIVKTTADYRKGVLKAPTPDHVDRWVKQFDDSVQLAILREMGYVLKKTYFSREKTERFLANLFRIKELAGHDPCTF